jgi:uncharacterized protein
MNLESMQRAAAPIKERTFSRSHAQRTAFVGRTLRGPVDTPVLVRSFAEFQRTFGGLWQASPLSYAIEHFFEQGGHQAIIVRVTNGARPATLTLSCGEEALQLEAAAPGAQEHLRAAVDYDQIDADDQQHFNLLVQRVRSAGSEHIEEQEIFRRLSVVADAPEYVTTVLAGSALVRVRGLAPAVRPRVTLLPESQQIGYVSSNADGSDGATLSDYDIIGSTQRRSGLCALEGVDDLTFVYVPPLSRTRDLGASSLLVAGELCRAQRAVLIVDPPAQWASPTAALEGFRKLDFYSDSALMFFPRVLATDRLSGRTEVFGNGGAVAGLLSRSGDAIAAVIRQEEPEAALRGNTRCALEVSPTDRVRLANYGINTFQGARILNRSRPALRTLACGASSSADWTFLAARRLALYVIDVIERETRWVLLEPKGAALWSSVTRQITDFLEELRAAGAFAMAASQTAFLVICDERINPPAERPTERGRTVNILVQFAANRARAFHSFMITHSVRGSSVRAVAVNRLEAALQISLDLEQEYIIPLDADDDIERALAAVPHWDGEVVDQRLRN